VFYKHVVTPLIATKFEHNAMTHSWMNYFVVVKRIVAKGQQDANHKL
jgi:hypothetical protein